MHPIHHQKIRDVVSFCEDILKRCDGQQYTYLDNSEYDVLIKSEPKEALRVYWMEILYRAHFAAASALHRNLAWFSGLQNAVESQNLFVASACLRSLIESAGDSSSVLIHIPKNLAKLNHEIADALNLNLDYYFISKELEDLLIHFTHARRLEKGEDAPKTHKAMQSIEYVRFLKKFPGMDKVEKLYEILNGFVHPTAYSVVAQTTAKGDEQKTVAFFFPAKTEKTLLETISTYKREVLGTFWCSIEPSLLTLKVLHRFKIFPKISELRSYKFVLHPLDEEVTITLRSRSIQGKKLYALDDPKTKQYLERKFDLFFPKLS